MSESFYYNLDDGSGLGEASSSVPEGAFYLGSFGAIQSEVNDSIERTLVVPDLHGDQDALKRLLNNSGFINSNENLIRPSVLRLVLLGDVINRGPQNKALLDYIIRIREDILDAGGEFISVKGNHELFLDNMLYGSGGFGEFGLACMKRYGVTFLRDFGILEDFNLHDIREIMFKESNKSYLSFFENMDMVQTFDDFLVVHGGINLKWARELTEKGVEHLNTSYRTALRRGDFSEYNKSGIERADNYEDLSDMEKNVLSKYARNNASMMWSDHSHLAKLSIFEQRDLYRFLSELNIKNILCGHDRGIIPRTYRLLGEEDHINVTCLDTGMSSYYGYRSYFGGMNIEHNEDGSFAFKALGANGNVYTTFEQMLVNE